LQRLKQKKKRDGEVSVEDYIHDRIVKVGGWGEGMGGMRSEGEGLGIEKTNRDRKIPGGKKNDFRLNLGKTRGPRQNLPRQLNRRA